MKSMLKKSAILKLVMCMCLCTVVTQGSTVDTLMKHTSLYGYAATEFGDMVNHKYGISGLQTPHTWMQNDYLILGVQTQFHPRLKGNIAINSWLFYSTTPDSLGEDPAHDMVGAATAFGIHNAEMIMNLSPDAKDSLLVLHMGLFHYKYNQEARNLGEYMFRTGAYPGYIYSAHFDMADAQLSGIRLSNTMLNNQWHNDLFLTSELYLYPQKDFSFSYLTDFTTTNKIISVGAGVQFYRCIPINNKMTQPKTYQFEPNSPTAYNYYFDKSDPLHKDTLYYTYAGTKIMARFTFDPKLLFDSHVFGTEDLKIYGEAIILGVKNYPGNSDTLSTSTSVQVNQINEFGYDTLMHKMPVMLGVNLPAFKILDVLSLEVEYYGKNYVNRVPVVTRNGKMTWLPVPYDQNFNTGAPEGGNLGQTRNYTKSLYFSDQAHWKWSVYAKKTIFNNFSITAQAARDHSLNQTNLQVYTDQEECLIKDNQWYWAFKLGYNF
jgi:hypothetical protein